MAGLGLPSGGGGDRTPYIKYNGKAGRFYRVDRSNASGSWETDEVEITDGFQALFDLENIETGWLNFPVGGAPDIKTVKIGTPMPDKPSDKHRAGFRVLMKLGKSIGGDVREMTSNAQVAIKSMDALYDAYLKDAGINAGKLPLVKLDKTIPVTSQGKDESGKLVSSTNYQPVWSIVKWLDRPPELVVGATPANEPKAEPVAQVKQISQVKPEPDPASDEEEF